MDILWAKYFYNEQINQLYKQLLSNSLAQIPHIHPQFVTCMMRKYLNKLQMPILVTEWCEIFGTEIYTVLGHISLIWSPLAAVNRAPQCRSINFTNEFRLSSKHLFHVQMIKTKIWGQAVISFCLNSVTPDLSLTPTCDCILMKKSLSLTYCQQSCPPFFLPTTHPAATVTSTSPLLLSSV